MSITLIARLIGLFAPVQAGTAQASNAMQADVDRLVRAAEALTGTWPTQPPQPIPEVAVVAQHGKRVTPLTLVAPSRPSTSAALPRR
jgi:hypothetical protein